MKLAVRPAWLWKCRGPAENPAVMMTTAMEFAGSNGTEQQWQRRWTRVENSEPEVKIVSLTILIADRPDMVLPIPFVPNDKGYAFALKEGTRYRLKFSFVVSNNIVSGLKYSNTVWKSGVRVENTRLMLGTFSPQQEPYTYELEEETTPSGIFARGSYSAKSKFADDDGKCYLNICYCFEIRKEWPQPS